MILFARYLGWLHATPEKQSESRLADMTRWQIPPQYPPLERAGYLADMLGELGWCEYSGGYPAPLSWGELSAWQSLTGTELDTWEAELLRQASGEYLRWQSKREQVDAPYEPENDSEDYLDAMNRKIQQVFGATSRRD